MKCLAQPFGSRPRRVRVLVHDQIRTVPEAALPVEEDMQTADDEP